MKRTLVFILLAVFMISGCQENEQDSPNGTYQATNDSAIYLQTDRDSLADNLTVTNSALEIDSTALSSSKQNQAIVSDKPQRKKGDPVGDVALSLIGEADASEVSDLTLQATDVALKENKAYVSYNQAGDVFAGAIQVIDVKDEESPEILAEMLFTDIDVNAIYLRGNTIYAVGAADTSTRDISSPAVLLIVSVQQGVPDSEITIIDLPSYAGTDVLVKGSYIFVTVGADGGGLVRVSTNSPESFNETNDFYSLEDARSLAVEGSTLGVLRGTEGKIVYFDTSLLTAQNNKLSSITSSREVDFANTATIPNSKSTIDMVTSVTLVALGDGGTKMIATDDSSNTEIVALDAIDGTDTLSADVTVTNAVTASQDLLFRANGEAGVDFYRLSQNIQSIQEGDAVTADRIGSISFESLTSANGLYYRQGLLFVADGLGGMKIIGVDRNYSSTTDEAEDDEQEDQDEEDNGD